MDGPWQVGHKTADEYGRLAAETAKTLRAFDKSLELIVCGSSHSDMPTYPDWERVVLEHTYDSVDHISLHMYFANRDEQHRQLSGAERTSSTRYIGTVASTIDFVQAKKRSKKKVTISFDEWNVWYHSNAAGPRHPRRQAAAGRMRRACSRTSTISRTCCRSAASSTPSSAAPTW